MDNNQLYHYGIKGMRWGKRRYQSAEGTLTDAGRRRYERDNVNSGKKKLAADPNRWVKEDMDRTKRLTDANAHMVGELRRANDTASKNKKKATMDLSSISDKELRDQINRKFLEKQYSDLFAPQNESRGREYVTKTLEAAGTVLAISSSALGIALAVKELRG